MKNILLSYPRSGNHLVRFFIELLSETPTYGCNLNKYDIEIYKNEFPEKIPFNISDFDKKKCYFKYHLPPPKSIQCNKLILIIRNPLEVLLRHNNYKLNIKGQWCSFENYYRNIDYYYNHKGGKLLLYYEDIITNKEKFINTLYDFLEINNIEKKKYVLLNLDKLYDYSSKGENRSWGGINSNTNDYYYKKIPKSIKEQFDNYIKDKIKIIRYSFLNKKYFLEENISKEDVKSNKIINYIIYHDKKELDKYFNISNSLFKTIDLNNIPLHTNLLIDFKEKDENEKITILNLSEINGILDIRNDTDNDFIGIFTYSIPKKFSLAWSKEKKLDFFYKNIFSFNDINNENIKYNKDYIYCIEIRGIESRFLKIFNDLHNSDLGINKTQKLELNKIKGPFKSSFIIEKKRFFLFQEWLKSATNWYLKEYNKKNKNKYPNNRYDIGNVLERFICYYIYQKYSRKLVSLQEYIKTHKQYLIISFCSYDYVKLAEIWVAELAKLNITDYIIISADEVTYKYLKSKNINTKLINYDKKESFWLYRIKVIHGFLEKETYDYLIHSDLDAIWKKNICAELFKNNNIDLFFSQGTIFPEEHLKKHKFVLCCGFFCIKSNEKTLKFMNKYINNLKKIKDDQIAINLELIETKWNTNNNDPKKLSNKKYIYYDNEINGYNQEYNINILLISFNKIQREFLDNNGYIYHILTPKRCSEKIDLFQKLNIIGKYESYLAHGIKTIAKDRIIEVKTPDPTIT